MLHFVFIYAWDASCLITFNKSDWKYKGLELPTLDQKNLKKKTTEVGKV